MYKTKGGFQLTLQTLSLVVGFMAWSIISPLMPYISQDVKVNPGQLSIILAIPVILGSILRVPFGYLTNIIGAKWVFFCSFVILLFPIFFLGQAQTPGMLMLSGFFLGVGGAIFSVGVTSVPKYFSKDKVGLANGIYGMGNIGTAVSSFLAPPIAGIIGWQTTVRSYLIIIAIFAILMFIFGDKNEPKVKVPLASQFKKLSSNYKLYYLSLWYFITFGAFVAFGLFLPNYLVNNFGIDKVDAGIRSGVFIALATFLRPIGGILGDKFNAVKVLMIDFIIMIVGAVILGISSHIALFTIGCLTISICAGLGNGLIFKLVPSYFAKESGAANGIVSMMGGLGGFFPPLVITYVTGLTGSSHLAFILLAIFGVLAFITMGHLYKKEYAK
ncbi:NarK/NasA family nitrate transporter [Staphylococcus sp. EG-SA-6]|jgi:NNP family putative nitrate transporter|uniref:Probable nitrate transporter NarT n=7 Tax=Bacillales TaxID=1385 RepID=NART_STAHJ|nr:MULTISPECIES: nitrate/nitrite transporter [Staphylococcus]Q4L8Q5.1 RecName: Full=Probable nitrate transporter NarT [Staphylococcus haemolyticus JCSC1435]KDP50234.1 putative nitrate transporter NarT [Staphylococcus aureus subsp. aureus CO-98]MBN4934239.1 NarK/NasA family nitrate transporter [Staphylococcus sp. EG-SA-6]MDU2096875.1 nitrate/nitrite transporter [Staphylococcus sp.]GEU18755.1 NarK/NasA family nitrate transporter [Bacillus anthracis]AKC75435.1 MFS family major facilitator transp